LSLVTDCWDYNDGASETRMGKALRYIGFTGHKDPHIHLLIGSA
jgi:hypothetical protein